MRSYYSKVNKLYLTHAANSLGCTFWDKAEINVKKRKKAHKTQKEKEETSNMSKEDKGEEWKPSPQLDMNMKLERHWTSKAIPVLLYAVDKSPDKIAEDKNYIQDY